MFYPGQEFDTLSASELNFLKQKAESAIRGVPPIVVSDQYGGKVIRLSQPLGFWAQVQTNGALDVASGLATYGAWQELSSATSGDLIVTGEHNFGNAGALYEVNANTNVPVDSNVWVQPVDGRYYFNFTSTSSTSGGTVNNNFTYITATCAFIGNLDVTSGFYLRTLPTTVINYPNGFPTPKIEYSGGNALITGSNLPTSGATSAGVGGWGNAMRTVSSASLDEWVYNAGSSVVTFDHNSILTPSLTQDYSMYAGNEVNLQYLPDLKKWAVVTPQFCLYLNGNFQAQEWGLDLIGGTNVTITYADDPGTRGRYTINATSTASYGRDMFYWRTAANRTGLRYYLGGTLGSGTASLTGSTGFQNGSMYALPFCTPRSGTLSSIGFWVTGAGSATCAWAALYKNTSDTDLYPSSLVADSGAISIPAGAPSTFYSASISTTLVDALYWLVLATGGAGAGTANITTLPAGTAWPILGTTSAKGAMGVGWNRTSGTWSYPPPGTFDANTGVDVVLNAANGTLPAVAVTYSA